MIFYSGLYSFGFWGWLSVIPGIPYLCCADKTMKKIQYTIFIIFILIGYVALNNSAEQNYIPWNQYVTSSVTGKNGVTVDYDSPDFRLVGTGDRVTLHVSLPEEQKVNNGVLCFYVYHSVVNAYFEDQSLYAYGAELAGKGTMIGAQYPQIHIPDSAWGKGITVTIDVREKSVFSRITSLRMYDQDNEYQYFLTKDASGLLMSIMGMFVGIILLIIILIFGRKTRSLLEPVYLLLFILSISTWVFTSTGAYRLFFKAHFWAELEFASLFFCPIPLCLYMYESENGIRMKHALKLIALGSSAFFIFTTVMNYANIIHYCDTLIYCHLVIMINIIFMVIAAVRRQKNNEASGRNLLVGVVLMLIFSMLDLLRFNLVKFIERFYSIRIPSVAPLGVVLLVVFLVMSFYTATTEKIIDSRINEKLRRMAYVDPLTRLGNRAKCDEILNEIRMHPALDYAVVSFDLNNLKELNDRLGHSTGDKLLQTFASLLKEAFSGNAEVVRMGGDEFTAIGLEKNAADLESCIRVLEKLIAKHNQSPGKEFTISVSYGTAESTSENRMKPGETISRADEKMYEMKREIKGVRARV
jgi:diguanylate cyclase (GGDEF)-like protein